DVVSSSVRRLRARARGAVPPSAAASRRTAGWQPNSGFRPPALSVHPRHPPRRGVPAHPSTCALLRVMPPRFPCHLLGGEPYVACLAKRNWTLVLPRAFGVTPLRRIV